MQILGRPSVFSIETLGLTGQAREFWNLTRGELIERAVKNQEGFVSNSGAFVVNTGKFTGRSPKDKYIVDYHKQRDAEIDWGAVNQPVSPDVVDELLTLIKQYIVDKDLYVQDLLVGNHPKYSQKVRVITETVWQSLFSLNLLIQQATPDAQFKPDFNVVCLPGFFAPQNFHGLRSGTFVILDFEKNLVLIGGTAYAGEIKKSVFSIMNRILPENGVLPMHCSANIGPSGDTALFFGLSGTGKTTLSSDPQRRLIGDDEHGWGEDGVFNFEGGCYAKTIGLNRTLEPIIWSASQGFGSILENVIIDGQTRELNFDDCSLTENSRAAYPLEYVPNAIIEERAGHPRNVFFLTADAFGVLPPISLLNEEQAMLYFLNGFTAKLAGTELGLGKEPQATFSTCYAAPFLPLSPIVYARLLAEKVREHRTKIWLINTGWTGGAYGRGHRIHLPDTRTLLHAAINGEIDEGLMETDEVFGLKIPRSIRGLKPLPGLSEDILNPINTWSDPRQYFEQANKLKALFDENAKQYYEGQ